MPDILRTVGDISRALDVIANIEFKDLNLTKGQYVYLVRIVENPGIIQSRLAELIKVDRTTVAHAVKKLEHNGLITREFSDTNKKNKGLFATNQGKKLYPLIIRENNYSNQNALAGLSPDQIDQLDQLLQQVMHNIETDWQQVISGQKRQY
ncbi:transcriptional regulator [Lapidilactobacillus dextrinicus DSM 20335]|uniref:Transcriptional regulator n=1 Tax=Lapidilactobacillus dextrinicus DSM 20335 TaxID=1423738 RepID=A0A0R2BSC6_9LACO|nr:MarR family transcriptional regulator [Lapidilactobacillus dextrinicus]KRM78355.1 transcriptional regulator [Lapidilactobacillus dextrinicus DSM 20335]QFG47347.1 MarR family transcriptional regulator [Lapidilactobacillus dextrinicus]